MSDSEIVKQEQPITYFAASNGEEMAKAQSGLVVWVQAKLTQIRKELRDVTKAVEHARENKWAIAPLVRQKNLWYGRRLYYEKMLEALKAGYVLIPEFPIDLFAIRTSRGNPLRQAVDRNNSWGDGVVIHPSSRSAVGSGDYKAARQQRFYDKTTEKDSQGKEQTTYHFYNDSEFSDVAFPLIAAKPDVMSATSRAMALKVFDSIGVCPQNRRTGDPLIIGVIEAPKVGYTQKRAHFLITWHINIDDL